ncbi:hypothetical protein ACI2KR_06500 [Pseudomonas luteola]
MRNKNRYLVGVGVMALALTAHAQDVFRYTYTLSSGVPYDWQKIEPTYSKWENKGEPYDCRNWSPSPSSIGKGLSYTQEATDCKQDQTRQAQPRQQDSRTQKIVNAGPPYTEQRTILASQQRSEIGTMEQWESIDPTYTDWTDTNALYGCTSWTPDPSIYTEKTEFSQTSTSCKTDQQRYRQEREQEQFTQEIRNDSAPAKETQTLTGQKSTRTYLQDFSGWVNKDNPYSCSNWSPDPSTVTVGQSFTQTATDCKQDQTRNNAGYYKGSNGSWVNVVPLNAQTRTLTSQKNTRAATGTKETWVATTSTYSTWANSSAVYGCTNWSPSPYNYTERTQFNQTATDCKIDQTRTRQDREQETTTKAYRNVGAAVTEKQTVGGQSSARSYLMDFTGWINRDAPYNCSNWSPDPSTVTINQAFTQTATNCQQKQIRGKQGYVLTNGAWATDIPYSEESRVLSNQSSTRTATGTKQTWVAIAPVYGGWYNTSGAYSCSNWYPDPSTVDQGAAFTQTSNACYVNQSRSRQDRIQETTTGEIRNNGAAVTENQTIGGQTGYQTAYGTRPTYRYDSANQIFCQFDGMTSRQMGGTWSIVTWKYDGATVTGYGGRGTPEQLCSQEVGKVRNGYTAGPLITNTSLGIKR